MRRRLCILAKGQQERGNGARNCGLDLDSPRPILAEIIVIVKSLL